MSNSFPKSYRLLKPKQYQTVFNQAEKFSNRHWTLIVKANGQSFPRMGLAITKKNLKLAVWRNRVKRLAREAFRHKIQDLNGYDIIVLGRRNMHEVDNEQLLKSFHHLIRKINQNSKKSLRI